MVQTTQSPACMSAQPAGRIHECYFPRPYEGTAWIAYNFRGGLPPLQLQMYRAEPQDHCTCKSQYSSALPLLDARIEEMDTDLAFLLSYDRDVQEEHTLVTLESLAMQCRGKGE